MVIQFNAIIFRYFLVIQMDLFSSVKIIAFTNSHCYTRWVFILVTMAIEENIRVLVLIMSKNVLWIDQRRNGLNLSDTVS